MASQMSRPRPGASSAAAVLGVLFFVSMAVIVSADVPPEQRTSLVAGDASRLDAVEKDILSQ